MDEQALKQAGQSLNILLEQARAQADVAQQQLLARERELTQVQAHGEALKAYERDTTARWHAQNGQGPLRGAAMLQTYAGFMHKLAAARAQQALQQQQALVAVQRARSMWQQAQVKTAALERVLEKRVLAVRRVQQVREQKLLDERAQRPPAALLAAPGGWPSGFGDNGWR
jgi:flagellar protein FliJ